MTVSGPMIKGQNVGCGAIPGNPCPFLEIVGLILPLISLWNYKVHKKLTTPKFPGPVAFWDSPHSVSGVCFSLDKSISYLSRCLSLNSSCKGTSRTWASISAEARCVISIKRLWVQVPVWVWPGVSPGPWVQVPVWAAWFHCPSKQHTNMLSFLPS